VILLPCHRHWVWRGNRHWCERARFVLWAWFCTTCIHSRQIVAAIPRCRWSCVSYRLPRNPVASCSAYDWVLRECVSERQRSPVSGTDLRGTHDAHVWSSDCRRCCSYCVLARSRLNRCDEPDAVDTWIRPRTSTCERSPSPRSGSHLRPESRSHWFSWCVASLGYRLCRCEDHVYLHGRHLK